MVLQASATKGSRRIAFHYNVDEDAKDGSLVLSYMFDAPGDFLVDVAYNGARVHHAPLQMRCRQPHADPNNSRVSQERNYGYVTELVTARVHIVDQFGQPYPAHASTLRSQVFHLQRDDFVMDAVITASSKEGVYHASFTPPVLGHYKLQVSLSGDPLSNSPLQVEVRANNTHAPDFKCIGQDVATAGEQISFTIHAFDGHLRTCGRDAFCVSITPAAKTVEVASPPLIPQIRDNNDGTYTVQWSTTQVGFYTIVVALNGVAQGSLRFQLQVLPAELDAGQCEVMVDHPLEVYAGEPVTFGIKSRDKYGNVRTQSSDNFKVLLFSAREKKQLELPGVVQDGAMGVYIATLHLEFADVYQISVMAENAVIKGSPVTCKVHPGMPSPAATSVRGKGLQEAQPGHPAEVLVHLCDAYGNRLSCPPDALPKVEVDVADPNDGRVYVSPARVNEANGTVCFEYTPTTLGKHAISAVVAGHLVNDPPTIVHVTAAVAPPSRESEVCADAGGVPPAVQNAVLSFPVVIKDPATLMEDHAGSMGSVLSRSLSDSLELNPCSSCGHISAAEGAASALKYPARSQIMPSLRTDIPTASADVPTLLPVPHGIDATWQGYTAEITQAELIQQHAESDGANADGNEGEVGEAAGSTTLRVPIHKRVPTRDCCALHSSHPEIHNLHPSNHHVQQPHRPAGMAGALGAGWQMDGGSPEAELHGRQTLQDQAHIFTHSNIVAPQPVPQRANRMLDGWDEEFGRDSGSQADSAKPGVLLQLLNRLKAKIGSSIEVEVCLVPLNFGGPLRAAFQRHLGKFLSRHGIKPQWKIAADRDQVSPERFTIALYKPADRLNASSVADLISRKAGAPDMLCFLVGQSSSRMAALKRSKNMTNPVEYAHLAESLRGPGDGTVRGLQDFFIKDSKVSSKLQIDNKPCYNAILEKIRETISWQEQARVMRTKSMA